MRIIVDALDDEGRVMGTQLDVDLTLLAEGYRAMLETRLGGVSVDDEGAVLLWPHGAVREREARRMVPVSADEVLSGRVCALTDLLADVTDLPDWQTNALRELRDAASREAERKEGAPNPDLQPAIDAGWFEYDSVAYWLAEIRQLAARIGAKSSPDRWLGAFDSNYYANGLTRAVHRLEQLLARHPEASPTGNRRIVDNSTERTTELDSGEEASPTDIQRKPQEKLWPGESVDYTAASPTELDALRAPDVVSEREARLARIATRYPEAAAEARRAGKEDVLRAARMDREEAAGDPPAFADWVREHFGELWDRYVDLYPNADPDLDDPEERELHEAIVRTVEGREEIEEEEEEEEEEDEDYEPPEGEAFRGGEAAAYQQEEQARVQRDLKR